MDDSVYSLNYPIYNSMSTPFSYPEINRDKERKEWELAQASINAVLNIDANELEALVKFDLIRYL